jgi:hypothetical protein
MSTTKKRINISLPADLEELLKRVAKRDTMPEATKAVNLLRLALEIEEDTQLETITEKRDKKSAKFVNHDAAWC